MDWITRSSKFLRRIVGKPVSDSRMSIAQIASEANASEELLLWCTSITEIMTSSTISAQGAVWNFYLNDLTVTDREKILSFIFEEDQRRSFASIMIQRAMIRNRLSVFDDDKYSIERTAEVRENWILLQFITFLVRRERRLKQLYLFDFSSSEQTICTGWYRSRFLELQRFTPWELCLHCVTRTFFGENCVKFLDS